MKLPERGRPADEVFATLEAYAGGDFPYESGRAFSHVFEPDPAVSALARRAYLRFLTPNALNPAAFPSALRLEREIVQMMAAHLGGGPETVGNFTSGGTESIMLAVKAARDRFLGTAGRRPGRVAEMVLPDTAHPAFHKAAAYLGVRAVVVPVDPGTFLADVGAMAAAVGEDTALLVGSAPSYPHGVIDPIEALGVLALERDVWLHVDACMGGLMLPYFRRAGGTVAPFDLSVPGVTTLSVDLHKYGMCPKGASLVLHADRAHRAHQLFAYTAWPGYALLNTTVQSSRSLGPMAAAWAVMNAMGDSGYEGLARALMETTRRLVDGVRAIDGLAVAGEPDFTLLTFYPRAGGGGYRLADALGRRGWLVQPQPAWDGLPANVHLCVLPGNVGHEGAFLADLAAAWEEVRTATVPIAGSGNAAVDLAGLMSGLGVSPDRLPDEMAPINELLETMPPELRTDLLRRFVNLLYG
ncbi:MAG: aspartate aminotransferase family protein [Deltaproteobacteria bacterium HGW-Deltaproteobacteria-14]|jgi:glutamate/tyrosine decarboxylase-like PLP-dependent enzyme|nr:MAG: aspartate aminotransferase family protein [Deltaproteobacteria bacterium HGW-Deltaproteobacteria-14]